MFMPSYVDKMCDKEHIKEFLKSGRDDYSRFENCFMVRHIEKVQTKMI